MSANLKIYLHESEEHPFDVDDGDHLRLYTEGNVLDPLGGFKLSEDVWNAFRYSEDPRPTRSITYRFHFGHLQSPLKPFVKRYCHEILLCGGRPLSSYGSQLPNVIRPADVFLRECGYTSLSALADPVVFQEMWEALRDPCAEDDGQGRYPISAVRRQLGTRRFWFWLQENYGVPSIVPPPAPHLQPNPNELSRDESAVIPDAVVRQLVNRLALHRSGILRLNPYNHLRLCVLMLIIASGRRVDEILSARRGTSNQPPLKRYPTLGGSEKGALWLRFRPNKGELSEHVFISPEWEELVTYCVGELCRYGDVVREIAAPEERELLILVSTWNWTAGCKFGTAVVPAPDHDFTRRGAQGGPPTRRSPSFIRRARGLSYDSLRAWLNGKVGKKYSKNRYHGIMYRWGITVDGTKDGEIYKFRTSFARHTRLTAIASDPKVPAAVRQRDLNHKGRNPQVHYQHQWKEQNRLLFERMRNGAMFGKAAAAVQSMKELDVLGVGAEGPNPRPMFQAGRPSLLDERWRALYRANRQLIEQAHRVPGGFCSRPEGGPRGCLDFLNCTSAGEGGCVHFCTDPNDPVMLGELNEIAHDLQEKQQASAASGREVQADKEAILARRAADFRDEAFKRSSAETLSHLKARQRTYEEEGL